MPHIEQRGPNSWRLIVENGYGPDNKRTPEKKTVRVTDAALMKAPSKLQNYLNLELAKFQMEVESGEYIKPEKMTFKNFVPEWKKNYANENLGEYTRKNYMANIETHLIPVFGHMKMNAIKPLHIANFLTSLRSPEGRKDGQVKPLATNTILNIYKALKSIIDFAVAMRMFKVNPMDGIDRPKMDKKEKKAMKAKKKSYTPEEASMLIDALTNEPVNWRYYYIGSLLGGFRRGEMLGVEWPAVDFVNGGINVEKQITFDEEGNGVEGEVKTEESEGFVPMPKWYMNELKQYQLHWKKEKMKCMHWKGEEKEYLFHNGSGEMYYPTTPTVNFRRLLIRHNLPLIRLHDLRHTTAKLLRAYGAAMIDIQEQLRHTRLATTTDFYTEKSEVISRETADRLEHLDPGYHIRSQSVPKR